MIDHGKTRSTIKPEQLVIDEYSVWIHSDIQSIHEMNSDHEFNGYEYNMIQYDKNEYIQMIANRNNETNNVLNIILGVA
jgi:hypothetical protein